MSDMTVCLNDLSYIPSNNEQNEPTQGDIGEASNKPTQAIRNEFEELYVSANEELYPGCDYVIRLDFMAKFTYFKVRGKLTYSIFNEMLEFFQNIFPTTKGYKLPPSYYAIKKTFKTISHTAKGMTWHATRKCTKPGKMQQPIDGRAWKNFDTKYPDFAKEPRNVQLGLATDGFNPFGNLSQSYSMWPMILKTYNLPPWLCMKESSFMLTLLILGPKSSSKDIDVYLRPLMDDLKDLWAKPGVKTIDACPTCNEDTPSMRVLSKTAYVGLRRFLKKPHKLRRLLDFNGEIEDGDPPRKFDRDDIMAQLARLPTHVMHIEKNVLESILNTLLMNDKSKDTAKTRQDLKRLGIQSGLWLGQNKNGKCTKPQAAYSFTPEERKKFCQFIKGVKLLDGFGSNFKHKETDNDYQYKQLKSMDCHILSNVYFQSDINNTSRIRIAKPILELVHSLSQNQLCNFDGGMDMLKAQSGPIRPWSMYPFDDSEEAKKIYVRNKAKQKGSIAEGYAAEKH
ncbi:hypothetical protein Tco_0401104 [Tanacetum coccineum]